MTRLIAMLVVVMACGCHDCPIYVLHKAVAPPNTPQECISEHFALQQDAGNATRDWREHIDYCNRIAAYLADKYAAEHQDTIMKGWQP